MKGGILALDLATTVGWASATSEAMTGWPSLPDFESGCGPIEGVAYGSHRIALPGTEHGRFYRAFRRWLESCLDEHRPRIVVYEAPAGRVIGGFEAARRAIGLTAHVDEIMCARGHPVREQSVMTVRKHFCGSGRAQKQQVLERCVFRGWAPKDTDAADALALLDYAVFKIIGKWGRDAA